MRCLSFVKQWFSTPVMVRVFRAKLHRATVTHADIAYEGSVTIPPDLLEASGILEFEAVHLWDVTNGARLETYAIKGKEGSRDICVNGAAAHLIHPGDQIIIATFAQMPIERAKHFKPQVVFLDGQNNIKAKRSEVAGPLTEVCR
jgi:aspartate 1-decarboxylase